MQGEALQKLVVLNLAVVALQPVILVFSGYFVVREIGFDAVSDLGWGFGVSLTWALFPSVLVVLGQARDERPPRWRQAGFLLTSFALPLALAIYRGDALLWVLFDLSSFHTLGIGLAVGATLLLGPFLELDIGEMRIRRARLRSPREILDLWSPIPIMLFVVAFLLAVGLLGPLAAEVVFVRHAGASTLALVGRYVLLLPEVLVIWGLFLSKSIYAAGPAPAETA